MVITTNEARANLRCAYVPLVAAHLAPARFALGCGRVASSKCERVFYRVLGL